MTDKVPLHDRIEEGNKVDSELDQSLAWVFNQEFEADFYEASRSLNHLYYQRTKGNLPTLDDDHGKLSDVEEQLEAGGDGDVSTLETSRL